MLLKVVFFCVVVFENWVGIWMFVVVVVVGVVVVFGLWFI